MLFLPAVPLFHARNLESLVGAIPANYNLMDSGQDFRPGLFGLFAASSHTWSTTDASITTGVNSPANDTTAQKLVEGSANSTHRVFVGDSDNPPGTNTSYLVLQQINAVVWRLACIAKPAGRNRIVLSVVAGRAGGGGTISAGFDLAGVQTGYNNVAGTGWTLVATNIQSIGGGWCLCTVDFTFAYANPIAYRQPSPVISLDNGSGTAANSTSYAGDGASGVNLWWFNLLPRGAWSLSNTAFFDDFKSLSNVDINDTKAAGFDWYPHGTWPSNSMLSAGNTNFFNSPATPPNYISQSGSIISFSNDISGGGIGLTTAVTAANAAGYIGQVWPLSFLAEAKAGWDPNIGTFSVPAFWTAAIEQLVGTAPAGGRYTEIDFFEAGAGSPENAPFAASSTFHSFKIELYNGDKPAQGVSAQTGSISINSRLVFASLWLGPADNDGVWGVRINFCQGVMTLLGDGHWSAIDAYNSTDSGPYPFGMWKETNYQSFPIMFGAGLDRPATFDWVKLYNNPNPPPTLYSSVATITGTTTATLAVSAAQSGGTLYWVVCTSAVIPTAAQIQAGKDHNDVAATRSGSQAVAATGAQPTISLTGLAVGTSYTAFLVQNKSGVVSNIDGPRSFPDATTAAWVTAVISNGGTVSLARQAVVDTFVKGLRDDDILKKFDRLWILAAENGPSALTDLIANALATTTGSPPFTIDRGYAGTDVGVATKYINTGFNPSVSGVTYTLNAAHCSVWCVGNVTVSSGGAGTLVGVGEGSNAGIIDTLNDGNIYARINEVGSGAQGVPGTRAGHWVVDRVDSTHTTAYHNGVSFSTPNATSTSLPTTSFAVLARHASSAGTFDGGNPNQAAMASMGGHLTAADATKFYNRLRTYMTAVGVP